MAETVWQQGSEWRALEPELDPAAEWLPLAWVTAPLGSSVLAQLQAAPIPAPSPDLPPPWGPALAHCLGILRP